MRRPWLPEKDKKTRKTRLLGEGAVYKRAGGFPFGIVSHTTLIKNRVFRVFLSLFIYISKLEGWWRVF